MKCRHCNSDRLSNFLDLGSAPPSNAYLTAEKLRVPEKWFPLKVLVCDSCWLVQTEDFASADELFDSDYAYFSGFSSSWLSHCERFVGEITSRFSLNTKSMVVEIAANDGYLLQYVKELNIPCLGIEPTKTTAASARDKGIPIVEEFFGVSLAEKLKADGKSADLIIANNVLAHVPDINDFVAGFAMLLKDAGVASFEFPHLLNLVEKSQFDTVYHEHFSYLSLTVVDSIFRKCGLSVFDVDELETHGGSLRVLAQRSETGCKERTSRVDNIFAKELSAGMTTHSYYSTFQRSAETVKNDFLEFLLDSKKEGKVVAAYGAAAKGNTLLNYAGAKEDLIAFVVDRNPAKKGKYMPGSRIPIVDEEVLRNTLPDYLVVFPWNLIEEISTQLSYVKAWGCKLVTIVPELNIR